MQEIMFKMLMILVVEGLLIYSMVKLIKFMFTEYMNTELTIKDKGKALKKFFNKGNNKLLYGIVYLNFAFLTFNGFDVFRIEENILLSLFIGSVLYMIKSTYDLIKRKKESKKTNG
jgi:hypothetical protein